MNKATYKCLTNSKHTCTLISADVIVLEVVVLGYKPITLYFENYDEYLSWRYHYVEEYHIPYVKDNFIVYDMIKLKEVI